MDTLILWEKQWKNTTAAKMGPNEAEKNVTNVGFLILDHKASLWLFTYYRSVTQNDSLLKNMAERGETWHKGQNLDSNQWWSKYDTRNSFTSSSVFCISPFAHSCILSCSSVLYLPLTSLLPFLLSPNYFTCTSRPPATLPILCATSPATFHTF